LSTSLILASSFIVGTNSVGRTASPYVLSISTSRSLARIVPSEPAWVPGFFSDHRPESTPDGAAVLS
jgi:hypothetical protein